jgi:hypothetical protein
MRKIVKIRPIMSMRRMTSRPMVRMRVMKTMRMVRMSRMEDPVGMLEMVPEMTFSGDVSVVSRRSPRTGE